MGTQCPDPSQMKRVDQTFGVGGLSFTLVGPEVWVKPFARAWAAWVDEPSGWEVHLEQDETLPSPQAPFFGTRPCFVAGGCLLESPGFAGEITPKDGVARLRAHPEADSGDIAYFVRTVFALQAFDQGALLFHSAGIVHRSAAYAFFGHSGSGKTSCWR